MKRRSFIRHFGLVSSGVTSLFATKGLYEADAIPTVRPAAPTASAFEMKADLVILGAGVGGCAAALAAVRNGLRVTMTEESNWIGGQLTKQAVPPDEHPYPWVDTFTSTLAYREFRSRVRDYYRRNYPLTAEARTRWSLNPGNGNVSSLCCEPRIALAALNEMLAP